jgi:hypothetical protein
MPADYAEGALVFITRAIDRDSVLRCFERAGMGVMEA